MKDFDIVVVGGGAVGAATALACAQALPGVRIAIVEAGLDQGAAVAAAPATEPQSPHVLALNLRSIRQLERFDIAAQTLPGGTCPFAALEVFDSDSSGSIRFDAADAHVPLLGHIVSASGLASALRARALDGAAITWFDQSPLQVLQRVGEAYAVRAGEHWLRARLVVGADGANSATRRLAEIPVQSWDYGQTALVALIAAERPHAAVARQWFTPDGPLALLPLDDPDSTRLAMVWSVQHAAAQQLQALPLTEVAAAASRASEYGLGQLTLLGAPVARPLRQSRALSYCAPGLALVGDAAHAVHPLAGLGINLGLADAGALAQTLAAAATAPLGAVAVLSRFERARMPENLAVMAVMEGFVRGFGNTAAPLGPLRAAALRMTSRSSLLKRRLMAMALGAEAGARGPFT